MKLKSNINCTEFFKRASECQGDIFYHTVEGDHINLKSVLSMYIFAMISTNPGYQLNGEIICDNKNDYEQLADYLIPDSK